MHWEQGIRERAESRGRRKHSFYNMFQYVNECEYEKNENQSRRHWRHLLCFVIFLAGGILICGNSCKLVEKAY